MLLKIATDFTENPGSPVKFVRVKQKTDRFHPDTIKRATGHSRINSAPFLRRVNNHP